MPGDKLFFRGDLKVTIIKANDLPNADGKDLKSKFDKFLKIEKKKDLSGKNRLTFIHFCPLFFFLHFMLYFYFKILYLSSRRV